MDLTNISTTNLVVWLMLGLIAGIIVHAVDGSNVRGGVFGSIVLGVLGAIVGGMLSTVIFGVQQIGLTTQGLLTAIIGALILSLFSRVLFHQTGHIKTTSTRLR